jgi:hypothetical protein
LSPPGPIIINRKGEKEIAMTAKKQQKSNKHATKPAITKAKGTRPKRTKAQSSKAKPVGKGRSVGFRTYDAELMNVLDHVHPNTERMYRKLFQRMNLTRGDRKAYPGRQTLQRESGLGNSPATLSRAIREAEHFRLISVFRPTIEEAIREKATNVYYLTPSEELPQGKELEELVFQWKQFKAAESAREKARKHRKLLSQDNEATITENEGYYHSDNGPLSQPKTNKDESNHYEYNHDESNQDEYTQEEEENLSEGKRELDSGSLSPDASSILSPDAFPHPPVPPPPLPQKRPFLPPDMIASNMKPEYAEYLRRGGNQLDWKQLLVEWSSYHSESELEEDHHEDKSRSDIDESVSLSFISSDDQQEGELLAGEDMSVDVPSVASVELEDHEEEVDANVEKERHREQLVAEYGQRILTVPQYNLNQDFHPDMEQFLLESPDRSRQAAAYNIASLEWENAHPEWQKQQQEKKSSEAKRLEAIVFAYQKLRRPDIPDFPTQESYERAVFEWEEQNSDWLKEHPWVRLRKTDHQERAGERATTPA